MKDLNSNIIRIKNRIKVSSFIPEGLQEMIEEKIPDNHYILGVTYRYGDSQICISGHPKENEEMTQGAERELMEELCLKNLFDWKIPSIDQARSEAFCHLLPMYGD